MRVLVIKTSSLGDVIHTLPALSDAAKAIPEVSFDWLVEEAFQIIPGWHAKVKNVIPVPFRRWRNTWIKAAFRGEIKRFLQDLRSRQYDAVIDAQGLLKSALLAKICRGPRLGFDWRSAKESLASMFYQKTAEASWSLHAVQRNRMLFAQSLGYSCPTSTANYGLDAARFVQQSPRNPYLVFLHGTTWPTKHWPESHWMALAELVSDAGWDIRLLWGNATELARAERIAAVVDQKNQKNKKNQKDGQAMVMPKLGLAEIADLLANAKGVVSVDTGLGHLAAALSVPTVSVYASTDPLRTGLVGDRQLHLSVAFPCAPCFSRNCQRTDLKTEALYPPCFSTITPEFLWQQFQKHIVT